MGWVFQWLVFTVVWLPLPVVAQDESWQIRPLHSLGQMDRAQTGTIKNVLVLNDGDRAISCGMDGTVCLWDLTQGKIIRRLEDKKFEAVYCMALVNNDQQVLAAGDGPGVALWDLATGQKTKQFDHDATIYSISVFPDQRSFVCGDADGKVLYFEITGDAARKTFRDESGDITALTVTPDHDGFVAGNDDGEVVRWKLNSDKPDQKFEGLTNWTCCLRFSNDGSQLFGSDYSGNVALWTTETQKPVWTKETLASDICWGHFVDDESLVVVDTDDSFYVLDRQTGQASKKTMVIPAAAGFDLSPDKSTFWSGGTNMICGWQIDTAERVFPADHVMQFANGIRSLAVRGQRAYVATSAPAVVVWDLESGQQLANIPFQGALDIDWDSLKLIDLENGLAICSQQGVTMADYESGDIIFAKKLSNTGFVKSPKSGFLAFTDRENTRLRELDLKTGSPKTLLEVGDGRAISEFYFLDQTSVAMMVGEYPDRMEIWALGSSQPANELIRESGFELKAGGQGLLVGKDDDAGIVVFASRELNQGPLETETIKRLIRDLDSGDYAVREAATRTLAGGGEPVLEILQSLIPMTLESRVRFEKIRKRMATAMMPDLKKPVAAKNGFTETAQSIGVDPRGRFFLMAVRDGWKSELLICPVSQEAWTIAKRYPLRSRAAVIHSVSDQSNTFAIGYVDGTVDVIEITAGGN